MKKLLKRIFSTLLTCMLLVGGFAGTSLEARAEGEADAFLMFADSAWAYGNWDAGHASTKITGDGSYSVTLNAADVRGEATAPATGAMVFGVDIVGGQAAMPAGKTYAVTALSIKADGQEVAVDTSKIITGDIEENGNYRIEIFNEYGYEGKTKAEPPIDVAAFTFNETLTVDFTIETVDIPEGGNSIRIGANQAGADAFLMFADSAWAYGNWDAGHASTRVMGDGKYSVTLNAADVRGEATAPATGAMVFGVDIVGGQAAMPAGKTYAVTGLAIKADGQDIAVDTSKIVTGDIEENGNYRIEIFNEYGYEGKTKAESPIDVAAFTFNETLTVDFEIVTVDIPEGGTSIRVGALDPNAVNNAFLMFTDGSWGYGNWDVNHASTKVTGDGSYSVTLNAADVRGEATAPATGIMVFGVDVTGGMSLVSEGKTFAVTALSVVADGVEVPVDVTKIVTGDIEENGNYRIEIFNEYGYQGLTKADPAIDAAAFTFNDTLTVNFTIATVDIAEGGTSILIGGAVEEVVEIAPFDPAGKYMAYLGLQTPSWTYRDPWNSANGLGSEYWGQFIYGNDSKKQFGVVTDAEVAGNGTYSVTITDFGTVFSDDFTAAKQDYFNLLYISTNIPRSDSIKITDVKIIMDGKTIKTFDEAYLDPDDEDYCKILIQNIWNEDVKELPFYNAPATSVEMKFTISGFNYDNAAAMATPAPAATAAPTEAPAASADSGNALPIVIAVIAAVVVAAGVVVVVLKKKKTDKK